MDIDKNKLRRQSEVLGNLRRQDYSGTFMACTGFGKTFTAILWYKKLCEITGKKLRLEVVVPYVNLKEDWTDAKRGHIDVHGLDRNYINVTVVNTYVKRTPVTTDCVIFDEVHHYVNDESLEFRKAITKTTAKYKLALSATLEDDELTTLEKDGMPLADTVTLTEGLENGYVAPFKVFSVPIKLGESEALEYEDINEKFKKFYAFFGYDLQTAMDCLNYNEASNYAFQIKKPVNVVKAMAINVVKYMHKRKQFIFNLEEKRHLATDIINEYPERKIIVFSENTDFVDQLHKMVGYDKAVAYHSNLVTKVLDESDKVVGTAKKVRVGGKKATRYFMQGDKTKYTWKEIQEAYPDRKLTRFSKEKQQKEAIRRFREGEVNVIITASALNEGTDIPEIDMAIICSGTSKQRANVQRMGRAVRFAPDKFSLIINIYAAGTKEAGWVKSRNKGIQKKEVKQDKLFAEINAILAEDNQLVAT